jgi:hypothetical protein
MVSEVCGENSNVSADRIINATSTLNDNIISVRPSVVRELRQTMHTYLRKVPINHATARLAAYIGNAVIEKNLCERRTPASISATAM